MFIQSTLNGSRESKNLSGGRYGILMYPDVVQVRILCGLNFLAGKAGRY